MKQINFDSVLGTIIAISAWLVVMVLLSPCLLIFTEGTDGGITVWNFVGIIYLLGVVWILGYVFKGKKAEKHRMDEIFHEATELKKGQEELRAKITMIRPYLCEKKNCKDRKGVNENGAAE